jgi:hypothetical protein
MKIVIGPRRSGRTSVALEWLLQGKPMKGYPGWSRVIVCATNNMVVHTTRELRILTQEWDVFAEHNEPHLDCPHGALCPGNAQSSPFRYDSRTLTDLRKAVWDLNDLRSSRGTHWSHRADDGGLEYCFDDIDQLFYQPVGVGVRPAMITMEGEQENVILL